MRMQVNLFPVSGVIQIGQISAHPSNTERTFIIYILRFIAA